MISVLQQISQITLVLNSFIIKKSNPMSYFKGSLKLSYRFAGSLHTKVPKTVQVQAETGFLARLFSKTKSSPSYLLLKQLFEYLEKSGMLQRQFPFIKSDSRFEQNWMLIHAVLLKNRLKLQQSYYKTISTVEIQTFNYNIQTYFFPKHGQVLNPHIPVRNFAQHFTEVYMKKLQLFEEFDYENQEANKMIRENGNREPLSLYGGFLRQVVYEDRVKLQDYELIKLCKYYAAHKKYLQSLDWHDLLEYKVKWGFEGDIKLIDTY